jgi:hypothetical protein
VESARCRISRLPRACLHPDCGTRLEGLIGRRSLPSSIVHVPCAEAVGSVERGGCGRSSAVRKMELDSGGCIGRNCAGCSYRASAGP